MEKNKFIQLLLETIECGKKMAVNENTHLTDIEGYDSLGVLSIIAMVDKKFGIKISGRQFASFKTVQDRIDCIGRDKII